jgi:pimeloyl-ACP methyl ester carboxylesterase/DNA-binding CsgD family transcriptional regulator
MAQLSPPLYKDDDIVALAYTMAVGTERFYELFDVLSAHMGSEVDLTNEPVNAGDNLRESLRQLEPHFHNALTLMSDAAARREKPKHSIRAMSDDLRPNALVTLKGEIRYVNAAATAQFGWQASGMLNAENFEPGSFTRLPSILAKLPSANNSELAGTFGVIRSDGSGVSRVGLRRVQSDRNEILGHISSLSMSWYPELAAEFKDAMNITPVELEIVKAVVTGTTLRDLAARRSRAVGTVRLQAKNLLGKLHLRSQTELACLYASFAELYRGTPSPLILETKDTKCSQLLNLADDRALEYDLIGPPNGRPVLFFPALLGGAAITPTMRQCLYQRNIRLIIVWRPGFSKSTFDGPPVFDAFERHVVDIRKLLSKLGVQSCPVIGHITSAMFAYSLASYAPDVVEKIICVNGTIPSSVGKHVAGIDKGERLRFMLLRRAPKIGRMIVHSLLTKVEAGFDEEYLSTFLDNDIDKATMQDPHIRTMFRAEFTKTVEQGFDSFVHELTLGSLNWETLVENTNCPIELIVGELNPVYTADLLSIYVHEHPRIKTSLVPNTGHLLLYQNFDRVLDAVRN